MGIYKKTLENINIMQIADFFSAYTVDKHMQEYNNLNDVEERENEAYDIMSKKLRKYIMNEEDWNSVLDIINEYLAISEDIHFMLGMKFLFKIFSQLQE